MPSTYLCCGKVGDNLVNYFSKDSVLLEKKKKQSLEATGERFSFIISYPEQKPDISGTKNLPLSYCQQSTTTSPNWGPHKMNRCDKGREGISQLVF